MVGGPVERGKIHPWGPLSPDCWGPKEEWQVGAPEQSEKGMVSQVLYLYASG